MNKNTYAAEQPTPASDPNAPCQNDVAKKLNTPSYDIASRPPEVLRTMIHDGVSTALKDDGHFRQVIRQLDKAF